jgi:hypothetical protein
LVIKSLSKKQTRKKRNNTVAIYKKSRSYDRDFCFITFAYCFLTIAFPL